MKNKKIKIHSLCSCTISFFFLFLFDSQASKAQLIYYTNYRPIRYLFNKIFISFIINMSTDLQNKIHNFLINAEERHINATAVIHQGLEENPWIPQSELRSIIDRVVGYISTSNSSSPSLQLKLIKVLSQVSYYIFTS